MSNFKYDVAVIGLGYVGLPLAIQATSSDLKVYGYDIDENKMLWENQVSDLKQVLGSS